MFDPFVLTDYAAGAMGIFLLIVALTLIDLFGHDQEE